MPTPKISYVTGTSTSLTVAPGGDALLNRQASTWTLLAVVPGAPTVWMSAESGVAQLESGLTSGLNVASPMSARM